MQMTNRIHFRSLRGDLLGGITAAIISLPLALVFGVASGAGPVAGLYGAVCVGFLCRIVWWHIHADFRANNFANCAIFGSESAKGWGDRHSYRFCLRE